MPWPFVLAYCVVIRKTLNGITSFAIVSSFFVRRKRAVMPVGKYLLIELDFSG